MKENKCADNTRKAAEIIELIEADGYDVSEVLSIALFAHNDSKMIGSVFAK